MTARVEHAPRLSWADATRAGGVIAVVVFHVLIWVHDPVFGRNTGVGPLWDRVNALLGTLRMPVLLAVAGVFASRSLVNSGSRRKAWTRSMSNYYLYVVWLLVYFAVFLVIGNATSPHYFDDLPSFVTQLVVPDTTLWFIFALAIYVPVILVARRLKLPVWALIALSVAAWFAAQHAGSGSLLLRCVESFVFFLAGVYGASLLRRSAVAPTWLALAVGVVFLGLMALRTTGVGSDSRVLELISALAAIPAVTAAAHQACRIPLVARSATFVGARTLPIYVLHPIVLVGVLVTPGQESLRPLMQNPLVDLLYPLALAAVVILLCLLIERLLVRIPGNPLLSLPPIIVNWVGGIGGKGRARRTAR